LLTDPYCIPLSPAPPRAFFYLFKSALISAN
jgi:hypothetical protein